MVEGKMLISVFSKKGVATCHSFFDCSKGEYLLLHRINIPATFVLFSHFLRWYKIEKV
jgi:hypothetical protein